MHIPNKFKQTDMAQLKNLMKEYPFATLVTYSEAGIEATHLPVIYRCVNGNELIQGHIAKVNKLWESVKNGSDVLLIFNGPNGYISPNYYPTKKVTGKAVPTWNYVVVQVKGHISFVHDEQWIYNLVDDLTQEHESGQAVPWSIKDAPDNYIKKMLPAIVGIEIAVGSIEGQWKLSQNQPEINKSGVVSGLLEEGDSSALSLSALVKNHF